MNIKYIMLSERIRTPKTTYSIISFIWCSAKGKTQGENEDPFLPGAEVRRGVDYTCVKKELRALMDDFVSLGGGYTIVFIGINS